MRVYRSMVLAVCATVLLIFTIAAERTLAAEPDALQKLQDRVEIADLLARYSRALDTLDADGYAAVFTEDGEFGSGERIRKGRAEVRKIITDLQDSRAARKAKGEPPTPAMYHVITNSSIEFLGNDQARHLSYWMTVFAGSSDNKTPARIAAVGHSEDIVVKSNGKWLIKTRKVMR